MNENTNLQKARKENTGARQSLNLERQDVTPKIKTHGNHENQNKEGTNGGEKQNPSAKTRFRQFMQVPPKQTNQAQAAKKKGVSSGSLKTKEVTDVTEKTNKYSKVNGLKLVFLGGVGEIGKNMTALEYGNDIIIIDCGLAFPGEDMPGIDLVIPDFSYLKENADKIRGIVITHGHEDHIGAIPYILKEINVPIYGSRLTIALIENKIKEHNLKNVKMQVCYSHNQLKLGCFNIEFVRVNHSIADAMALSITTPVGVVFHTGDFKIDFEPIDGNMIDLPKIAEIGKKGVLLLLSESTNVERPGYTASESTIGMRLDKIFEENNTRRIFVATFSSNIYRIQQIVDLAIKHKRKVAIIGRSMINNIEASSKVGAFRFPKEAFIDVEKLNRYDDKNLLILSTGSQGEPTSALSRLANGEYNRVEISGNDTVILSSSPIPGNENMVNKVINNLYRKGAIVIHEDVHSSGHACSEELKTIYSLINPKFFIPVHGEYRHLKKHAMLAEALGTPRENILIAEIGTVVGLTPKTMIEVGKVQAGELLVDGSGIGDTGSVVLRDRKLLSEDGLVIVVMAMNEASGELINEPYMITRGFVYTAEAEKLVEEAKGILTNTLKSIDRASAKDFGELRNIIRKPLRNFFYKETKRNPMILPIIYRM